MRKRNMLLLMLAAFLLSTGLKLGVEWLSLHSERFAEFVPLLCIIAGLISFIWLALSGLFFRPWPAVFSALVVICLIMSTVVHSAVPIHIIWRAVLFLLALFFAIELLLDTDSSGLLDDPHYSLGNTALFAVGGICFIALSSLITIRMLVPG